MGVMDRYNEKKKKLDTSSGESSKSGVMQRYETKKYYSQFDTSGVNQAYIDAFYNDWKNFASSAEKDYGGLGWGNASSSYESRNAAWKDLSARADVLEAYYFKNRNNVTDADGYSKMVNDLNDIRSSASDILKSFQAEADYYSNFATEDEFNEWNKYSHIPEASDFAEKSGYVSTYRGGEKYNAFANMYTDTGFDDIMYDYINRDENARQIKAVNDISNNSSFLGFDKSERREMSDEEISIFNYIYATQGKDAAYEYVDHITAGPVGLSARQRAKETEAWASYAKESPVASSVFSVLEAPLKGLSYIGQAADYISDGKIDQNAGYNKFSYINSAIRNQVTQDVEKNWGGVGSFAYQTGMSMADFLFTTAVSGGNSALSLGIMGTGAAADTVIYAKDRGLSDHQAFALGTIAGAAEIVTEKISLDTLLDATQLGKNALGYIAKNMIAEGSEEVLSSSINLIADVMISRDKSEWREAINAYKAVGMDDQKAFWHAVGDQALSLGLDFLGGAVSGGVMGGGGVALNAVNKAVNTSAQGAELKGSGIDAAEITRETLEINPDNRYAQKMQGNIDGGKTLSDYQLGKLAQQKESALFSQDKAKIKSAVEARLTELGETGDVARLADVITKAQAGETLTRSENAVLNSSQNAQQVFSELDPENNESDWTGKIGTDRINAEAYSRLIAEMEAQPAPQTEAQTAPQAEAAPVTEGEGVKEGATAGAVEAPAGTVNQTEATTVPNAEHIPESTKPGSEGEHSVDVNNMPAETTAETAGEEESTVSLEEASAKYGDQAQAMVRTYQEGQDVQQYDSAYQMAYDMGKSGVSLSYVMQSKSTEYLTKQQRELAYEAGQAAAGIMAKTQHEKVKAAANGKTGRKKGTVKGEGVTMADLKKTFNDTQNRAYRILTTFAEATGVDIVLYQSKTNENGDYVGAQGKFNRTDDKIYIDINAGLQNIKDADELAKYAMLRTFSHEFTHFLEKYNAVWYNDFRKVVFETLTARGEDVNELIETKQAQNPGMDYDKASREVIAEAMTDILPDSQFIETLANKHKNIFTKLHDMLKEFLADLKAYFSSIGHNPSREANALKEQIGEAVRYVDNIVKMFDEGAAAAVDNYQMTVATDIETSTETEVTKHDERQEKNRTEDALAGGNPNDEGSSARTSEKDSNRSGVSKELGETKSELPQSRTDERQHRDEEIIRSLLNQENYISPKKGSPLYEAQRILTEEYAMECHILKATAWKNESFACAYNGKIYVSENIDEDTLKSLVPHESTHVMKQKDFMPYRDFIDNAPQLIDYTTESAQKLFDLISDHIGFDVFDTDDISLIRKYYDELNATIYGIQQGGLIYDKEFDYEWIPGAFYDFEAYIRELSDIHEQFKAEIRAKKSNSKATESTVAVSADKNANKELETPIYEVHKTLDDTIVNVSDEAIPNGILKAGEYNVTEEEVSAPEQYDHFSISDNAEHGSLEIKFDGKPSDEILAMLKEYKFRWHKAKGVWYGKSDRAEIAKALQAVYKAYDIGVKEAQTQKSIIPPEKSAEMSKLMDEIQKNLIPILDAYNRGVADEINRQTVAEVDAEKETETAKDQYDELANALQKYTRHDIGGIRFEIKNHDGKYSVSIRRINNEGPYPIENARDSIYKNENIQTYEEAVQELVDVARSSNLFKYLDTKAESANNEEVKPNVTENVDNRETVRQSDTDRQGDSPVLEGSQAADVSGNAQSGDSVGDSVERGQETRRDGDSADHGTGTRGGSGDGDRQSGDLRRDDDVTPEEASEKAEQLHEEVAEQIEQKSTETPKGKNFVIGDSISLPNGEKARYKANVDAIRLVKKLEAEGRYTTEAEQAILSKYVGWGGIANAFDERKSDWSKEYGELKELLTDEEYKAARGSTLNAHYTDISVIKAMYDGLNQLGFNGGRMMEPSAGVGNFVGAMPAEMSAKVKSWTMVELDNITGLIAKYLYPNADVRIQGFEKANIPNNYMDVIISNVPFGNYPITDKAYPKKVTSAIHNYFFAKSLDKVRPGGIVMFITSSYTMNSKDETVRRYIMQKADLLGAIRLPDTAFKGNAGTEVVTDILILKKRADGTPYAGEDFLSSPWGYPVKNNYNGAYVNSYFDAHPEMVLGTPSMEGGMYRSGSLTYKALEGKGSLADQIRKAFSHIKGKMDYPAKPSPENANFAAERASKKTKKDGYVAKDGKIYQNKDGELVEQSLDPKVAERIKGMLEIRDAQKALMTAQKQGLKESEIKGARKKLNSLYDDFVKKNGFLNAPANRNAFSADPDRYSLLSLEKWNPDTKKATKADIFAKNTVSQNRTVTSAKDVSEGLIVSVNQTGGVDTALIAKLTGKTAEDVQRELIDTGKAFKNRDGVLETAETYLSGNVRAKLRDAEALVPIDRDYQKNVDALKTVMPKDVSYQDIFVNPGTPWIPNSVYSDFAAYMLGGRNNAYSQDVDITRNAQTGNFVIDLKNFRLKINSQNTQKWGTPRRSFIELLDAMLNSKSVVIKDKLDDGSYVINKDATAAANEKIENIQKEFQEWLWKDEARRAELTLLYNETFNSIVTPKYNGDNLTVNGANALKPLRPHQRNAVQRVISSGGNTLLAHKVGAGKTYEMAAAAMKLKELGLVKKPMFAVPKSLVAQWGNEFIDFFPTAKLLVAEASDFTPANRKIFMNRVANGDYDAVIVSYEQFEKLPISDDFARGLYQEQIDSIVAAIEEAKAEKGAKALSVKDLEKKRKSLQAKIDKLTDKAKDEDNIDFEGLGVDSLFIDEAHNFKNLFYTTSMTNVAGLGNKDGSKRAFDLYTKVRYLQKLNGGRGIVFATATPVMNSMSEMYIMQKYLQPDLLEQLGLNTFDAWAKQFGEVVNGVEIKPSGQGYRVKQSFSRFKNMSELQLLFRNFADVLTDIPGLKIPKMKGGKVNVVVCEPGQFQQDYMKELEKRADNIKNVDPSVDNMLKITSDGRKISYTQRMIDPTLPYEEGCKIYRCADNVVKAYKESNDVKGTQLIFCDMATPKGKSKTESSETDDSAMDMESAKLYEDIRERLIQNGIPAKEIAFIHEADTDQKKKKLFADVNDGKVRVLIGSTGKMGVGMNAQKRVVAIHHLDAPWRPGDVEQRNGRAFRQGNINDEVECFTYVTEGSFDARLWDILERKQNFINQVMNGESVGREAEDTGEVTLSAAEVKALASGSPLILEQVQLDTDIKKLESLYRAHLSAERAAKERLLDDKVKIEAFENLIANGKADVRATKDTYSEGKFSITIGKHKFTDKKEAGVALMAEATAKAVEEKFVSIGSFAGFEVSVLKTKEGIKGHISGKQSYPFNTYPNNTTYMINQMISVVEGIPGTVEAWETSLRETKKDMAEQEKLITEPFAKQSELDAKRKRYNEVMAILNPKEEQSLDSSDDDVQEQSRDYLGDEQYQQRTNTLTDREILEMAANEIDITGLSEAEQGALTIFQNRLSDLKDLQEKRVEQGRLYKDQQFGPKPDRAEAAKTLNRMHVLDEKIKKAYAAVLSVEEKEVLQRVLKKSRKVVEAQQREHDREMLYRYRDRRNNAAAIKKYRERLRADVDELTNWILKPDNKDIVKHVPDVIKKSVIPFLSSIDFMSKRSLKGGAATKADEAFVNTLRKLNDSMRTNVDLEGMYSGYNDLPPDFLQRLQIFINITEGIVKKHSGEIAINLMTSEEIKELSQIVKTLKTYIVQINRFHNNAMFQHVYEAGDDSIETLNGMHNAGERTGTISNFLFWQQIRPGYAFERFGKGGMSIYNELRDGQAKLAFNTKEIERFSKEAYTAKEVHDWEDEIKEFKLGSDIVKIPVSHIMSFYELYKDPEAREHITGEGIRVATYKRNGKKISDVGHILSFMELNRIIDSLTDRQKEVADKLQKYMAEQGGKWGNHVSLARFGEELFTNKNYFPINSDGRHLSAKVEEHPNGAALYALLNMSFTKSRKEGANNRIILYSIFDVFANHMASMAQYNAMALPVLDAVKWFNYQQVFIDDQGKKTPITTLRAQLDRVYGAPEETRPGSGKKGYATSFVENILKAFNGTAAQGTPYDTIGLKSLRKFNMAQVAYNFRVAIQQPMAITRAGMLIDYKSIRKGMTLKPAAIKKNIEEMQKYSGIAAWKSLGFYDVNISRGLTHLIKHDNTFLDRVGDVGMWGAEKLDTLTWAAMWSACKEEVIRKKNLTPSSEGFYREVTRLFEEVIYKTQVVDSILTKNEFMRDKGTWARLVGSFMSESTTNASMLLNAVDKYNLDIKQGMAKKQAWQKNKKMIGRAFYVYGVGAVILAAFQAVADAWRDDDDYENYGEKWLDAFVGNVIDELAPFNKLPIVSDFYDLGKEILSVFGVDTYGNPPQSVFMQWYDSLVKGTEIIYDKIMGENTNYTWWGGIFKLLQAASGATGIAGANATRELVSAWNTLIVPMAPSLRLETYGATAEEDRNALYEAIIAGDTKEVARIEAKYKNQSDINTAIRKALRDNDPRIKEAAQAKFNGDIAEYTRITDAIFADGKFDERDIVAAINAEISAMSEKPASKPSDKEVSRYKIEVYYTSITNGDSASAYAVKYDLIETDIANGKDRDEAEKKFNSDLTSYIQDEFKKGNITDYKARDMLSYAGKSAEEAAEKVQYWGFKKNYPDYDIPERAVSDWYSDVKPSGISLSVYYDYTKKSTKATGVDNNGDGKADSGTKKSEILQIIHSLPISSYQKDVLYRLNGWAESTLYQAPWH